MSIPFKPTQGKLVGEVQGLEQLPAAMAGFGVSMSLDAPGLTLLLDSPCGPLPPIFLGPESIAALKSAIQDWEKMTAQMQATGSN